mmetsp:Transcript_30700/g.46375  ORF Transcript_30700/g.46375 Transcript_30700/m.46375 type:complete len:82 (+) Transcript_30700:129-374(+)
MQGWGDGGAACARRHTSQAQRRRPPPAVYWFNQWVAAPQVGSGRWEVEKAVDKAHPDRTPSPPTTVSRPCRRIGVRTFGLS